MTKNKGSTRLIGRVLTVAAMYIYCFLVFWLVGSVFERYTELSPISFATSSYFFEPLAIFLTAGMLALLLRRIALSLILVTGFYVVFMLINAEMFKVFGLLFSPIDIIHGAQVFLVPGLWLDYWMAFLLIGLLLFLLVMIVIKTKPNQVLHRHRYLSISLLVVALFLVGVWRNDIAKSIFKTFGLEGKVLPINLSQRHGFLFGFYYKVLKHQPIKPPAGYSKDTIDQIAAKYTAQKTGDSQLKPDVIIFFIEAFADPKQMGIETSYDPIPNFRKFAQQSLSGLVISPEIGGRSANPEFELLTGLSMRFMPEKSIPYIDYLNKPMSSLIREFKQHGYTSSAIHVASMDFFNYLKAYPYLGFDHYYTLWQKEGMVKDPKGIYPSEAMLVEEIIAVTEASDDPQFIFSFPNSTHGPWDYPAYDHSDLEVFGTYFEGGQAQLRTYINALHRADQAIGQLINHYQNNNEPAVILVMGDHQPGLPEFRQSIAMDFLDANFSTDNIKNRIHFKWKFLKHMKQKDDNDELKSLDVYIKSHQVPYFIWNNFDNQQIPQNTSMNLLSSQILTIAQLSKSPLFNLLTEIQNNLQEFHKESIISEQHRSWIQDYELLQYDIISGEQHYQQFEP